MYVEYSKIDDKVYVTDDKNNVKEYDNTNNFETIMMLENEKCASNNRIKEERNSQKKYKNYRNFIGGLSFISLTNSFVSMASSNDHVSPILTGALVLTSFATIGVMQGLVRTFDKKINNIKIYQKALDKEINYEISKGKKVKVSENERGIFDNNRSSMKLTYDKYDLMHQVIVDDYRNNHKITFPLFDEREKRIFKTMIEEENKKQSKKVKVKEI